MKLLIDIRGTCLGVTVRKGSAGRRYRQQREFWREEAPGLIRVVPPIFSVPREGIEDIGFLFQMKNGG